MHGEQAVSTFYDVAYGSAGWGGGPFTEVCRRSPKRLVHTEDLRLAVSKLF